MQCLQNRVVVVACGGGRDSTGMLVGLHERNIQHEAILFADVGGEKSGTYQFIPHLQAWLARVKFPPLTIVRYEPVRAPYSTLAGNIPPKSACFFCPNQRPEEVEELSEEERAKIVRMELRAEPYNRKVHGLWHGHAALWARLAQ